jgi:hypothetical protein
LQYINTNSRFHGGETSKAVPRKRPRIRMRGLEFTPR